MSAPTCSSGSRTQAWTSRITGEKKGMKNAVTALFEPKRENHGWTPMGTDEVEVLQGKVWGSDQIEEASVCTNVDRRRRRGRGRRPRPCTEPIQYPEAVSEQEGSRMPGSELGPGVDPDPDADTDPERSSTDPRSSKLQSVYR